MFRASWPALYALWNVSREPQHMFYGFSIKLIRAYQMFHAAVKHMFWPIEHVLWLTEHVQWTIKHVPWSITHLIPWIKQILWAIKHVLDPSIFVIKITTQCFKPHLLFFMAYKHKYIINHVFCFRNAPHCIDPIVLCHMLERAVLFARRNFQMFLQIIAASIGHCRSTPLLGPSHFFSEKKTNVRRLAMFALNYPMMIIDSACVGVYMANDWSIVCVLFKFVIVKCGHSVTSFDVLQMRCDDKQQMVTQITKIRCDI